MRALYSPGFVTFILLLQVPAGAAELPVADRQADFKAFAHDFGEQYAYRERSDKPWLTWESRYAKAIKTAASKEAFSAVIALAISELHDFHAEVRSQMPNRWLPVPTFADIWAEFRGGQAVVIAIRPGSDAERAGIAAGDRITKIGAATIDQAVSARLGAFGTGKEATSRNWALLSVLAGRSDEARTISFVNKSFVNKSFINKSGNEQTVTLQVKRRFDRSAGALTATTLSGNIGVIRFNNSIGEEATVTAFDRALEQLKSTSGLILDLRDVPSGGDSSVALGIMGRFVKTMLPYQRHRIPGYGQADVERNWLELVAPRGPFTYTAPMAVLVDHWTGSMGEGMAVGFDAMKRAVVVGTAMAHLAGAVGDLHLSRTGVDVAFATEQLFHINGTPRQDWLPPVLVDAGGSRNEDPVLVRGLAELGSLGAGGR